MSGTVAQTGLNSINLNPHPQLVAFDLDHTLWDVWVDTVTGPLRRHEDNINEVLDKYGEPISLYKDVAEILHNLRLRYRSEGSNSKDIEDQKVIIAACSRTPVPDLAFECLRLLLVPPHDEKSTPTPAIEFFDEFEIYPGSKIKHFKAIHARTGVPYSEMLFFDDERRNAEVETLGVTFQEVPNGLTHRIFEKGLKKWRRRQIET